MLDQTSFGIRQVGVALGGLLTSREVLVPAERIYDAKEGTVTLDLSAEEVAALPDLGEPPEAARDGAEGELSELNAMGPLTHIEPAFGTAYLAPPESAARVISAGAAVYARAGKLR